MIRSLFRDMTQYDTPKYLSIDVLLSLLSCFFLIVFIGQSAFGNSAFKHMGFRLCNTQGIGYWITDYTVLFLVFMW